MSETVCRSDWGPDEMLALSSVAEEDVEEVVELGVWPLALAALLGGEPCAPPFITALLPPADRSDKAGDDCCC